LANGAPAGEKLVDSWNSYFAAQVSIDQILVISPATTPKFSWGDLNDMYTYAQYLYRSQRYSVPHKNLA